MVVVGRVACSTSGLRVWLGTALTACANMSANPFAVLLVSALVVEVLLTVLALVVLLTELFTVLLTELLRAVVIDMSFLQ
jgi:hypothetical protein